MDVFLVVVGKELGNNDIDFLKVCETSHEANEFAKSHSSMWARVYGVKYIGNDRAYYLLRTYTLNELSFLEDFYGKFD